jgi:hypothetical protein
VSKLPSLLNLARIDLLTPPTPGGAAPPPNIIFPLGSRIEAKIKLENPGVGTSVIPLEPKEVSGEPSALYLARAIFAGWPFHRVEEG